LQIQRIFYPIKTLGYGRRIGIWTVGCPHRCPGCSNPELQQPDATKDISIAYIAKITDQIKSQNTKIDGVTISGGEPFMQAEELAELVPYLKKNISNDILIYTGFTREELERQNSPAVAKVLTCTSALIDGPYMEKLNDNSALRGSSNQRLHIFNKRYRHRYEKLLGSSRTVQTVFFGTSVISFGIPARNYRLDMDSNLQRRGIVHERHLDEMAP